MKIVTASEGRAARLGNLAWRFEDLDGKRFGRLRVVRTADKDKSGHYRWSCLCDCGVSKVINGYSLRSRHTVSCGCFEAEHRRLRMFVRTQANKLLQRTIANALRCIECGKSETATKALLRRQFDLLARHPFQSRTYRQRHDITKLQK